MVCLDVDLCYNGKLDNEGLFLGISTLIDPL